MTYFHFVVMLINKNDFIYNKNRFTHNISTFILFDYLGCFYLMVIQNRINKYNNKIVTTQQCSKHDNCPSEGVGDWWRENNGRRKGDGEEWTENGVDRRAE